MSRPGRLILSVLVIGLSGWFVYDFLQQLAADRQRRCMRNLLDIEGAKEQYALDHQEEAPGSFDVLRPDYLADVPGCPSGGTYALGDLQQTVLCSREDHAFPLNSP